MDPDLLENNICPICLYIFIQPVTMPCKHELCLSCFKQNVEEANFCCPMCRTRISTWARRAARTNSLVNQTRWEDIQLRFPSQVQCRLAGLEEEDEEMNALNISIKLAEPGEIRCEYEEQLKKLRVQRAEENKKEQEASEQLIKKLQEEEHRKRRELEMLQKQDEELAKALSEKEAMSSLEQRTRSALSNQSEDETANNMEDFLNKMRKENNPSKSPYPYQCLSPLPSGEGKLCVDKDKVKQMEKKFQQQKLKKDRSLVTTQDIAILEEQFKLNALKTATDGIEIDCLRKATGSATSLTATMTKVVSSTNLNQDEILDQMSDMDITLKAVDNDDDVIVIPSPIPVRPPSTRSSTRDEDSSQNSKSRHVSERSTSAQSTDSISVELSHFRPIRSCPLTPPRVLPSGKVVEPQLIRTTPRNLSKTGFGSPIETNLSDIDAGSPIMKRRLSELAEERNNQVLRFSKSTSTGSSTVDDENRNPDDVASPLLTRHSIRSSCSSRGEEFKDISNSPFQKRKFDFNEDEIEDSPAKKKLILSLEPNLDDNNVVLPDPLEIVRINPGKSEAVKSCDQTPSKRNRLSKAKHAKSGRVRYTVDESGTRSPQSSIMQWVTKGENSKVCLNNNSVLGGFMSLSRDEVDGESGLRGKHRGKNGVSSTKTSGPLDQFLSQSSTSQNNNYSRPKRSRKSLRQSDYIYAEDEKESKQTAAFSDTSPRKRSLISLEVDSDSSRDSFLPSDVRVKVEKPDGSYEPIPYCDNSSADAPRQKHSKSEDVIFINNKHRSSKQRAAKMNNSTSSRSKVKSKNTKTMHDFFSSKSHNDSDPLNLEGIQSLNCVDQEEEDRLYALKLQQQFELEARLNLTAARFKGTGNEYSLRRNVSSDS